MEYTNKKINITIADNCKEFCDIFYEYLSNQRDIVVTGVTNDGVELLKLIQETKPDLVIFDVIMHHLDGLGVLERLKTMNLFPMPRIIILSTISEKEIIEKALRLGADHFIEKPFEFDALNKIIKQMFGNNLHNNNIGKVLN